MQHKKHHHKEHRDRDSFFKGRKFSSDDIQLLVLHFLSQNPSYGYELIKLCTDKSNGFYTPSPGVIYPALTYLEEIGYIDVQADGTRKQYSLATMGRDFLAKHEEDTNKILDKFKHLAKKMESVKEAIDSNPRENELITELKEAIHHLRHILHSISHLDKDTQLRISGLIRQLSDEITKIKQ